MSTRSEQLQCTFRAAIPGDIPDIARIFLAGLDTSIPGRALATEFYTWERDVVAEDGRLRRRLLKEQENEYVEVVVTDGGEIGGYMNWTEPNLKEGVYTPGEITFLFIDPSLHGLGLGSTLIKRAQNAAQQAFSTLNHLSAGRDTQPIGPVVMFVKCFTANIAGLRAYKRRGFVRKKEYLEEDVQEQMTVLEWDASSASLTQ